MKILNLKFKNINSLYGENEIDFTKPVFVNEGLFAITGKTGAGKSSILDAISLAFYGRTPRVDITGSENAVMTKGEKDCYAEITFEVAGKIWKSSWKQERTRTGTLKPVNRQIADADNKIIADQLKTCNDEIVKIIGLTFEQFTKVIMLAQGSFAAFLQADKNDKGQLLEQITGTEIYAEISKNIFERNRSEQDKLKAIALELEAIKILSEDEIEILSNKNFDLEKEKVRIETELQQLEVAKKWLADLASLQAQISQAKEKLPELEEKFKTTTETFDKSTIVFEIAKVEQKKQEPIFKKVRELDTKISEKEKLLNPMLSAIAELEKAKNEISHTIENQCKELEQSQKLLLEKQQWATENQKYEDLVSNYNAIEKENQLLIDSHDEIENLLTEILNLQKSAESKKAEVAIAAENFNKRDNNLTEQLKELDAIKANLAALLGGRELSTLQLEKENISNFGILIKSLFDIENLLIISQQEIESLDEKLKQFEKLSNEISNSIKADKKTIEGLEISINILDENIKLTKTIQSLEEHRHSLKDGEECPLCGALEHPFAKGNVPIIGEKENELVSLKSQLQNHTRTAQQNETKLATLVSDNGNALKNKEKEEEKLLKYASKQLEILSEIKSIDAAFSIPDGENKLERLTEMLAQKRAELKELNALIEKATLGEKQLVNLRDIEIPALHEEKQVAEKFNSDTITAQKLADQILKATQESANKLQDKYKIQNSMLMEKLKKYAVENIGALKACLNSWNDNKKQIDALSFQITTLKSHIALHSKELDSITTTYLDKQKEKQALEIEKQQLSDERKGIFEDKSVEAAEKELKILVEDAESAKVIAEKKRNDAYTEFEKYKAIFTEKEKELAKVQGLKITERSSEDIQVECEEKKIKSDELSQELGANKQTIKSNADNLLASGSKLKIKEKQQAVCNKWSVLNDLIGSSDGKKYRNFAQALTFEHLIALSNKQLSKMSDRYVLKRSGNDSANPFELAVIDQFQHNEERTAKNLSGGEKFIVSLSMALGLSKMASKNMSIDTMFIDEGFGTLDPDYLDVALNALSNLQSEGKIIGVISHLTELKERIATHIEVVPSGNGYSKIQITN